MVFVRERKKCRKNNNNLSELARAARLLVARYALWNYGIKRGEDRDVESE